MRIGYARVSTPDQNLDMQISALEAAGCDRVYSEKESGKTTDRPELEKLLAFLRPGDELVVWKLDRLGRTVKQLMELLAEFDARGVKFVSLTESVDTSTPMGKFLVTVLAAMAQMEADVIRERTMEGLAEARRKGHRSGPKPRKADDAERAMAAHEGGMTVREACELVGISKDTYYRYKPQIEAAEKD